MLGDEAYKRLKAEYEGKLRKIKGEAETETLEEEGTRVKKDLFSLKEYR
ncbi:hypothetical protein [Candidatus Methanodesulfokora washburnensis]|nr:hypothetical protein [Candidatus Methanodesulfokores washburnensis]